MNARDAVRAYLEGERENLNATLYDLIVVPYPSDDETLKNYLKAGHKSEVAWTACIKFVEHYTRDKKPLPDPLSEFVLDILRGDRKRPGKSGRPKYKNASRDSIIVEAIRIALARDEEARGFAVHRGQEPGPALRATRNNTSTKKSACDVVVECLQDMGYKGLSFDAVLEVWKARPPHN